MSNSTYNTKQKKLVLDLMQSNGQKQLTCDEITYLLLKNGTPVGKTTVYRQLEKLADDGVIRKFSSNSSKCFYYQYVDLDMKCNEHMHLRCINCGKYEHLSCDFMKTFSEHISLHHGFSVSNSQTEIMGFCVNCR